MKPPKTPHETTQNQDETTQYQDEKLLSGRQKSWSGVTVISNWRGVHYQA